MKKLFILLTIAATGLLFSCKEKAEVEVQPTLELGFTGDIDLPAEGCDTSFAYVLTSPAANGVLVASVPEDITWLSGFTTATDTTVTFTVKANDTEASRTAEVTLTYTYGEDKTLTKKFNAIQAAPKANPDDNENPDDEEDPDDEENPDTQKVPVINAETTISVPAAGGNTTLEYTITDAAEDGELKAEAPNAEWIKNITVGTEAVTFNVDANPGSADRQATLTLSYTYATDKTAEPVKVTVIQGGVEPADAYNLSYSVKTYKETSEAGVYEFITWLSDQPFSNGQPASGSKTFKFNIFGKAMDASLIFPAIGEYTLGSNGASNTFTASADGLTFTSGTLSIGIDGSSFKLTFELTDNTGKNYVITHTAPDTAYTPDSGEDPGGEEPGGEEPGGEEPGGEEPGGDDQPVVPGGLNHVYALCEEYDEDKYMYYIYLSDQPIIAEDYYASFAEGSKGYYLQLASPLPEDKNNPVPTSGTYTYVTNSVYLVFSNMAFTCEPNTDETFTGGTLTISTNGDNLVINAQMTSANGTTDFSYSGPVDFFIM